MTIEMPETRNVAKVPSTDLVMPFKTRGLSYTLEVNISSPLRGIGSSSYFSTLGPSFSGMATHPPTFSLVAYCLFGFILLID